MACLLVDVGNSRVKWSDPERLSLGSISAFATEDLSNSLCMQWSGLKRPDAVWISSVAGDRTDGVMRHWVSQTWGITAHFLLATDHQLGVSNGYQTPSQLGIDRWLALIAARALSHLPLIVVDCGPAVTVDGMDATGQHLGGLILPGQRLMRESLTGKTAIADLVESSSRDYFAMNTAAGIHSGALLATSCLIEKIYEIMSEQSKTEVSCFLTGGGAELIKDSLDIPLKHEPALVLSGLALVAKASTAS